MSQQTGKYILVECIDCGEKFAVAHRGQPPVSCPKCRVGGHYKCYIRQNRRIRLEAERKKAEMLVRLAKRDKAAKPIRTVSATVGGRIIEKRGNVPISSMATCRGRY